MVINLFIFSIFILVVLTIFNDNIENNTKE